MATAPSPNDLTRQQLDELDALLQKMLTVPLAPVDTPPPAANLQPLAPPPVPPSWRVDPPAPAPSLAHLANPEAPPTLKFEPPPAPAPTLPPAPAAKAPKADPAPKPEPVAKAAPTPAPVPAPAPKPIPKPVPTVTAPKSAPAPKPVVAAPPAPASDAPPVPLVAIPFVALNGLFDGVCGMFGPPGRLFRSGFFKQIYGLTGLGLIVYTVLHVAQVQGWLSIPVPLPWPK